MGSQNFSFLIALGWSTASALVLANDPAMYRSLLDRFVGYFGVLHILFEPYLLDYQS